MKIFLVLFNLFYISTVFSNELTLSSYNCGGLSDHYDYLRAAAMQKIMKQRYADEPKLMALNEKIQQAALKILFSSDENFLECNLGNKIYLNPSNEQSPNFKWYQKLIIRLLLIKFVLSKFTTTK